MWEFVVIWSQFAVKVIRRKQFCPSSFWNFPNSNCGILTQRFMNDSNKVCNLSLCSDSYNIAVQLAMFVGAGIRQDEQCIQNLVGKPEGKIPEDICVNGRIILKWILRKWGMSVDWIQSF
jgi:hypothetical protein